MRETHSDNDVGLRIAPGALGFYTHVEVTEIFVVRGDCAPSLVSAQLQA